MSLSRERLLEAIETSFFIYPELPRLVERLPVPGVRGRVTPLSHPLLNLVGAAALDEHNVDDAIRRVHAIFAARHKAYGWVTGPYSTPADLGARLLGAGLTRAEDLAGMALTDLSRPVAAHPGVCVREVTAADFRAHGDLLANSYGLPADVAIFLGDLLARARGAVKLRAYFAFLDDLAQVPIAFSTLLYLPDSPIVLLGGAATLPEHRGHGVYSGMVARRLADARADGAQAAVVQAVRATSAPICARLDFAELSALEMFAWMPG